MGWRADNAPGQANLGQVPVQLTTRSKILLGVVACLVVLIGAVALQPQSNLGSPSVPVAAVVPEPVVAPEPAPTFEVAAANASVVEPVQAPAVTPEPEVSRADASLLELRQAVYSRDASHLLRQPIAGGVAGDQFIDLPKVTTSVLAGFGYRVRAGDRLHALLVQALAEQKSNAYIDALLNTAAARGEFVPPFQLRTSTGRLDTQTLLQAILRQARG